MKKLLLVSFILLLSACSYAPLNLDGCPVNERPCMEKGGSEGGESDS